MLHQVVTKPCGHSLKFKNAKTEFMPDLSESEFKRLLQGSTAPTSNGQTYQDPQSQQQQPAQQQIYRIPGGNPNVNDGWHPIRIAMDYRSANRLINQQPALRAKYEMSVRIVETVRSYFSNALNVNFPPIMRFGGGSCYDNSIPPFEAAYDLLVTVQAENTQEDYFAAATSCRQSSRDGRTVIGAYILNFQGLKATALNEHLYFSTYAHEFTHILGFNDDLWSYTIDSSGRRRKLEEVVGRMSIPTDSGTVETFTTIRLPEMVQFARTYFNCPTLEGIPIENGGGQGSAGSHWEKLFLPHEYMNPTVENPGIISEFTLRFLEASGWYKVNLNLAQRYDWSQGAGCDVFRICPAAGAGYCSRNQIGSSICSSEWMSKVELYLTLRVSATLTRLSSPSALSNVLESILVWIQSLHLKTSGLASSMDQAPDVSTSKVEECLIHDAIQ